MNASTKLQLAIGFVWVIGQYADLRDSGGDPERLEELKAEVLALVARWPELESHPLVLEYEIEFLNP